MDLNEETYKASPLNAETLAEEIRKYYVENITGIKNGQVKDSYAQENASVWVEFVKESFITLQDEQDSIAWESYQAINVPSSILWENPFLHVKVKYIFF